MTVQVTASHSSPVQKFVQHLALAAGRRADEAVTELYQAGFLIYSLIASSCNKPLLTTAWLVRMDGPQR